MQDKKSYISGAKGSSSSGSSTAVRTPDNLRSEDTVEVLLGLGEGPWKGLKDGLKSFYIGDTALQNQNDSYNFEGFVLEFFPGVDEASPVVFSLGGTTSNNAVGLTLASGVSVTRQTESGDIDYIDVRLAISQLYTVNDSGTYNASMTLRIEYKALSAATWTKMYGEDITLSGKTTSSYAREFRIPVERISEAYEVRVTKVSSDTTTTYIAEVAWESYQEVVAEQVSHNNTAMLRLTGKASDQFSSIPDWAGDYETKIIKVPTNYDPETREYTGIWDGTFKMAYSNNPAWCLYDFVMSDRFGIASYYPDVVLNKYDVYEAAQWCDELVPDGVGGTQPRYTMNLYMTEARSGKELASYMAGAFNSVIFDDLNEMAFLKVDKDDDATHIFTKENVIDGKFDYSYTDITSRYNDITVSFLNEKLDFTEDRRRVKDDVLILRNGPIPLDFIAVGCIDAHEAVRRAQNKLLTANTETCMVTFKTNRKGQFVNPFDVMLICDPDMGYGISGRIKSLNSTRDVITLRDPIYLEAGIAYTIKIELADGSTLESTMTGTFKGYNTVLRLNATLPEDIVPDKTVFTLEHSTLLGTPRPFRVLKVEEVDGSPDEYSIEGININRNKWYDSDNVTYSGDIDYSVLPSPFNPPGPVSVSFLERYIKNSKEFHLTISAEFDSTGYKYYSQIHPFEVWSRLKGTNDSFVFRNLIGNDTVVNHPPGVYEFKILGKSYLGSTTNINSAQVFEFNVTNPKTPPKDVDWVLINDKEVYWGYENAPDDFAGFQVRYHNQVGRTTWDDAIIAHQGLLTATQMYTNLIPNSSRTILVRAVDDFGITSENSAVIFKDIGEIRTQNVVEQFDYHLLGFTGEKQNCSVVDGVLKAQDLGDLFYSGNPNSFVYDGGDFYVSTYSNMSYQDTFEISVAGSLSFDVDFEGTGYELKIRDAENPTSNWVTVPSSMSIPAGVYEFIIIILGGKQRGIINKLSAIIDVPDISEEVNDLEVPATGIINVPLLKNYSVIKTVSVIIQGTGVVSYPPVASRVLDKDVINGPLIEILDISGNRTAAVVDVIIKGY